MADATRGFVPVIRYLLDTNAVGDWINYRFGVDVRANVARSRGHVVGTCEPIVAELYYGAEKSSAHEDNLDLLRATNRNWNQ